MPSNTFSYQKNTPTGIGSEQIPLSTVLILQQAEKFGVKWESNIDTKILRLEYKGKVKYFRWQVSSETSFIGFHACLDKGETKNLLRQANVSVSPGFKLIASDSESYWREVFQTLKKPLVVKPSHGLQVKEIHLGITDEATYFDAVKKSFLFTDQEDSGVIVETQFNGKEYRIVATREKVVAVLYREPANVVGDGTSTIQQLIEQKNSDPRRGSDLNYALFKIDIDEDLKDTLTESHLSLTSIPSVNQKVYVRKVSNIARGGDSIDITDEVDPNVKEIAVRAMQAIPELGFAGIDMMTTDITKPQTSESYIIVEINSSPGICINEIPFKGEKRNTDREFLFVMFPELASENIK